MLPLALAGCVKWAHAYKPREQFAYDDAVCQQEAIGKVEYKAQEHQAPKWLAKATGSKSFMADGNEMLRAQWHRSCLQREGWSLRPTGSQRQVAYSSPYNIDSRHTDSRYINRR